MEASDWAAWAAVKSVVEAITRTGLVTPKDLQAFMKSEDFTLDTYQGAPASFASPSSCTPPTSSIRWDWIDPAASANSHDLPDGVTNRT